MKLELQKHVENITSRQDLIAALQNIWRRIGGHVGQKKGSSNYLRLYIKE